MSYLLPQTQRDHTRRTIADHFFAVFEAGAPQDTHCHPEHRQPQRQDRLALEHRPST
jgi:hypothetical protein